MRLVASSDPGAVDRDRAWWLLREHVVLTTAVCAELRCWVGERGNGHRRGR